MQARRRLVNAGLTIELGRAVPRENDLKSQGGEMLSFFTLHFHGAMHGWVSSSIELRSIGDLFCLSQTTYLPLVIG